MRNLPASALSLPVHGLARAVSRIRRSGFVQLSLVAAAIAVLVAGLLVGLPAKPVAGQTLPTFAPLAPQGEGHRSESNLPLDVPFQVQFTKPMDESTVESALTITPQVNVRFVWDATGQVLNLAPVPHWEPYTQYTVDISVQATDQEGLSLANAIDTSFQSGSPTAGTITATRIVGDRVSPSTAFQITFTRPVKLSTVMLRFGISPQVDFSIVGDDPTDAASEVFTLTPKIPLDTDVTYVVSMADGGADSAGATLQPAAALTVKTLQTPSVVTFTPQDGSLVNDTNKPIAIQFSVAMDQKSTAAALSVTSYGRSLQGTTSWSDDGLTMVFAPRYSYYVGSVITVRVAASARSVGGLGMKAAASATFTIARPKSRVVPYSATKIQWTGAVGSAPYGGSEQYYLSLMNCTRTGGWVTAGGDCSTQTHHTLPARSAFVLDEGISSKVSRPYAKALAERGELTHYLDGTTPHGRLTAAGYPSGSWAENIASPSNAGQSGMVQVEIYFQEESPIRYGTTHYKNIMSPYFHRVGIGVWVAGGVRVCVDFYG